MNKQELASTIWTIADGLRKKIKASQYKDYILGFMFYKYLSDKEVEFVKSQDGTIKDLNVEDEKTINFYKDKIGYFIHYNDLFKTLKDKGSKLGAKDVSEALEHFNDNISKDYGNVFDGVFNTLEKGLTELGENSGSRDRAIRDLVAMVDRIPATSKDYDVMGYIYEYLIQKFSSAAKDDGAFYTPHEVTKLMSRIIADRTKDKKELSIYDPCLGSGGLLLNIGEEASRYINPDKITYYGQELITETYNLARENLVMKGVKAQNICVRNGDTLDEDWPYFDENTPYKPLFVDATSANPPYSQGYLPSNLKDDARFKGYGLAPAGCADYAFLLHCLYHIKDDGIMTIVLPHGVLFRGGSEGEIRKNLLKNHNIETVIGLPANLFYATSIPTIILVLSKNRTASDVLFVDASKCFVKEGKQNVLREKDIQKIFDVVKNRESVENFSRLVPLSVIEENEYNLNIPRYVSAGGESETFDLYSLMTGTISEEELYKSNSLWEHIPELKDKLLNIDNGCVTIKDFDLKEAIYSIKPVQGYLGDYKFAVDKFEKELKEILFNEKYSPETEHKIKETLFSTIGSGCGFIVDKYDAYQEFANRWTSIKLDLENIASNGKEICKQTEVNYVTKKVGEEYVDDPKGYKGKIFDLNFIKKELFTTDFDKINDLNTKAEGKQEEIDSLYEELEDSIKSSISKDEEAVIDEKKLKAAIKKDNNESLIQIQTLINEKKALLKEVKDITKALDDKAKEKIESLTDNEVDELLYTKWVKPIIEGISKLADETINDFIKQIESLKAKYSNSLDSLNKEIDETSNNLLDMISELSGSDKDNKALKMLAEVLNDK